MGTFVAITADFRVDLSKFLDPPESRSELICFTMLSRPGPRQLVRHRELAVQTYF
jgi:hypothetical protein